MNRLPRVPRRAAAKVARASQVPARCDHDALVAACGSQLDAAHRWGHELGEDRVLLVLDDDGLPGRRLRQALPACRTLWVDYARTVCAAVSRAELRLMLPAGSADEILRDGDELFPGQTLLVVVAGVAGLAIYGWSLPSNADGAA